MHCRTEQRGGIAKTMDEVGWIVKTMEAHRCQHLEEGVTRCMTVNLTIPEASWYVPLDIGKLERGLREHFTSAQQNDMRITEKPSSDSSVVMA